MTSADPPSPVRVRLLTVCTGNICRSPYAALTLAAGLERARPGAFEVTSAGTHALVGQEVDEPVAGLLRHRGVAPEAARARLLTPEVLAGQDAVLAMSVEHAEAVVALVPSLRRRTFTLLGLVDAIDGVGRNHDWMSLFEDVGAPDATARWQTLPAVLDAVPRRRRFARRRPDVADPYRRGDRAFAKMARQIDPAVEALVRWEGQFYR